MSNGKSNPNKPGKTKPDSPATTPPAETVKVTPGTVMLPNAISYNDGPNGLVQSQNVPLSTIGRYLRQYRASGNPTWVDSPPEIPVTDPSTAVQIPIEFSGQTGWQIIYLGP